MLGTVKRPAACLFCSKKFPQRQVSACHSIYKGIVSGLAALRDERSDLKHCLAILSKKGSIRHWSVALLVKPVVAGTAAVTINTQLLLHCTLHSNTPHLNADTLLGATSHLQCMPFVRPHRGSIFSADVSTGRLHFALTHTLVQDAIHWPADAVKVFRYTAQWTSPTSFLLAEEQVIHEFDARRPAEGGGASSDSSDGGLDWERTAPVSESSRPAGLYAGTQHASA